MAGLKPEIVAKNIARLHFFSRLTWRNRLSDFKKSQAQIIIFIKFFFVPG